MIVAIASDNERKLVEELGYSHYPIVVTGIGAINVIQSLKNISRDEEIVNIGYAASSPPPSPPSAASTIPPPAVPLRSSNWASTARLKSSVPKPIPAI